MLTHIQFCDRPQVIFAYNCAHPPSPLEVLGPWPAVGILCGQLPMLYPLGILTMNTWVPVQDSFVLNISSPPSWTLDHGCPADVLMVLLKVQVPGQ